MLYSSDVRFLVADPVITKYYFVITMRRPFSFALSAFPLISVLEVRSRLRGCEGKSSSLYPQGNYTSERWACSTLRVRERGDECTVVLAERQRNIFSQNSAASGLLSPRGTARRTHIWRSRGEDWRLYPLARNRPASPGRKYGILSLHFCSCSNNLLA